MTSSQAPRQQNWPLDLLCCPITHKPLDLQGDVLVADPQHRYRIDEHGIPLFAETVLSPEAERQRRHYDRVAPGYVKNTSYPHTAEYTGYLDRLFMQALQRASLATVAEICCGQSDVAHLLGARVGQGVGVDISTCMLSSAVAANPGSPFCFVQGDATQLPLRDGVFDCVVMSGGIHHVNDRRALFAEVARVLKPGGALVFREPLNDFALWRWLRTLVYRVSPALDEQTERPLTRQATAAQLGEAGLDLTTWQPCGFLGFCVLMNSDVLVLNRLLRYWPGIRMVARAAADFDDWATSLAPGVGLQVVGLATKK